MTHSHQTGERGGDRKNGRCKVGGDRKNGRCKVGERFNNETREWKNREREEPGNSETVEHGNRIRRGRLEQRNTERDKQ